MGFFPPDYKPASGESSGSKSEPNPKYWEFSSKHLGDGETISFRPCGIFDTGHVVTGYQYFTMEGRIRRFPKYPKDFAEDIGLTWAAKNAKPELEKLEAEGKAKDRPKFFMSFINYFLIARTSSASPSPRRRCANRSRQSWTWRTTSSWSPAWPTSLSL